MRTTQGFTLFEVLIAVMILGIALPLLFQLFQGSLRTAKKARDYTQALSVAQEKIEELIVMTTPPLEPESGQHDNGLYWERTIIPTEPLPDEPDIDIPDDASDPEEEEEGAVIPTLGAQLYEVTVAVRRDSDPSSPATQLYTLTSFQSAPPVEGDPELLDELSTPPSTEQPNGQTTP